MRYLPIKIFGILVSVFLLASCDSLHVKDYYVENDLDQDILVKFSIEGALDSTIVSVDSTKLIYADMYVFGQVGVRDERSDDKISAISIRIDSIEKIISEDLWEYEQKDKFYADYFIKIDSTIY